MNLERELVGLAGTFLGDLDLSTVTTLMATATLLDLTRGQAIGDGFARQTAFVLSGNVRVFITAPDGRQLTVRYARPGSLIATTANLAGNLVSLKAQALTTSTLIEFDGATFNKLRRNNKSFTGALSAEQGRRLEDVYRAFAMTVFGTIRERLAAHLLDTAEPTGDGRLEAPFTHRDLAEALGSAREVVSRALADLQRADIVGSVRGGIEILDASGLSDIAGAWWSPTNVLTVDPQNAGALFEAAQSAVLAVDARGEIVYANEAAARTFGWPIRELVGKSLANLLPKGTGDAFRARLGAWMAAPRPGPIGFGQGFHGQRADGSEFPAEVTLLPARTASGLLVFAKVADVSYREALRALVHAEQKPPQVGVPLTA